MLNVERGMMKFMCLGISKMLLCDLCAFFVPSVVSTQNAFTF